MKYTPYRGLGAFRVCSVRCGFRNPSKVPLCGVLEGLKAHHANRPRLEATSFLDKVAELGMESR